MSGLSELRRRREANEALARGLREASPHEARFAFTDLRTAERHGVLGAWVARFPEGKQLLRGLDVRFVRLVDAQVRIHEAIQRAGVRHVFVKGLIAGAAWPVPSLRPQSDIDVLVTPEQLPHAVAALSALTGAPTSTTQMHRQLPLLGVPDAYVEVHDRLSLDFPIESASALLARAVVHQVEGRSFPALHPVDRMAHLLIHAATHATSRYLWLLDVALLGAQFDSSMWEQVVARCTSWRASTAAWWVLTRVSEVLGVSVEAVERPSRASAQVLRALGPWAEVDDPQGVFQRAFRLALHGRRLPLVAGKSLARLVGR